MAPPDAKPDRRQRIAADFQPNPNYDRLLKLRDAGDPRWGAAGRSAQLAASMYEAQRATTTETSGTHS
jgi:hypothetical protein